MEGLRRTRRLFCLLILLSVMSTLMLSVLWSARVKISHLIPESTIGLDINLPPSAWDSAFEKNLTNKWIVVADRVGKLTKTITYPGHTILVVGHSQQQEERLWCGSPDCVFMFPDEQKQYGKRIQKILPNSAKVRRLVGFLYAISQGAHVIYQRQLFHHNEACFLSDRNTYTIMNVHMNGERTFLPEVVAYEDVNSVPWHTYKKYVLRDLHTCQQLSNATVKSETTLNKSMPTSKSETKPDLLDSSFNNQFTVFDFSIQSFSFTTFWASIFHILYDALGEPPVLKLLQEAGYNIPPRDIFVHAKEYSYDLKQAREVEKALNGWHCVDKGTYFNCLREMAAFLHIRGFFKYSDIKLIIAWMEDLSDVGYFGPEMNRTKQNTITAKSEGAEFFQSLSFFCPNLTFTYGLPSITDIALIITFNKDTFYQHISKLLTMYGRYFKNIIFCGPHIHQFTKTISGIRDGTSFLFIESFKNNWYFFYDCMMLAMQLNLDVKGYLQIGDDTLLNPWSLKTLPRDKLWLTKDLRRMNISLRESNWGWWEDGIGKTAVITTFMDLMHLNSSARISSNMYNDFLVQFGRNSEGNNYLFRMPCDFFYVPKLYARPYIEIGRLFLKNAVMVELAHPIISMGLAPSAEILMFEEGSLWWGEDRSEPWLFYHASKTFIHPFKLSELNYEGAREFFCDFYMKDNIDRYREK